MSRPHALRSVLRHLPLDSIHEFLGHRKVSVGADWAGLVEGDTRAFDQARPELLGPGGPEPILGPGAVTGWPADTPDRLVAAGAEAGAATAARCPGCDHDHVESVR
ncbi:hypothetical protein J0H58_23690 [bacterium]|mgnify:CR=1 FL=1|nr:hypothetical protein [bacterium]